MITLIKRGLILVGLMLLPLVALAEEAPQGLDYHKWILEQKSGEKGGQHGPTASNAAAKQLFSDAGGPLQLDYRLQTDYSAMLARLKALLLDPAWFGECEEARKFGQMLDASGAFNLRQYREALSIDKDLLRYSIATDYSGLSPDSYKGQLYSQPNLPFASSHYVNSNVLFYFGMQNVPQTALKMLRQLASNPEALQDGPFGEMMDEALGDMGDMDLAQVAGMLDMLNIEGTVNELLTGEVAVAMYGVRDMSAAVQGDFQPQDVDAAAFVGVRDAAAVAGMLNAYGADMGLQSLGEDQGWQLWSFAEDVPVTLALNNEVLLATMNWEAARARMMLRISRLEVPQGQYYLNLNIDGLCQMLQPLAGMAESELLDMDELRAAFDQHGWPSMDKLDAGLRYLLDMDNAGGCGALTIAGSYDNGYRSELTMRPAVFSYGMFHLGRWAGLAMAQEEMLNKNSSAEPEEEVSNDYLEHSGAGAAPEEIEVASADLDAILGGSDEDLR